MAERKRRAADRDTRRDSLLVLLSRIQRAVPITPAEASLLRAHVEVEITESNELRATVAGQQDGIQRNIRQLNAAHAAIEEAEAALAEERATFGSLADAHAATLIRAAQAEAALDRVRAALAPYDWPHAQVCAAAVRDALAPPQPTETDHQEQQP